MSSTTVTEKQRQLAIEKADALATMLRDGTVALLTGKSDPQQATPILERLMVLLQAAGCDTDAILGDALTLAHDAPSNGADVPWGLHNTIEEGR